MSGHCIFLSLMCNRRKCPCVNIYLKNVNVCVCGCVQDTVSVLLLANKRLIECSSHKTLRLETISPFSEPELDITQLNPTAGKPTSLSKGRRHGGARYSKSLLTNTEKLSTQYNSVFSRS